VLWFSIKTYIFRVAFLYITPRVSICYQICLRVYDQGGVYNIRWSSTLVKNLISALCIELHRRKVEGEICRTNTFTVPFVSALKLNCRHLCNNNNEKQQTLNILYVNVHHNGSAFRIQKSLDSKLLCFTHFCYQFTQLLSLRPLIFGLTPFSLYICIYFSFSLWEYFLYAFLIYAHFSSNMVAASDMAIMWLRVIATFFWTHCENSEWIAAYISRGCILTAI
jgi:hypothetical protein